MSGRPTAVCQSVAGTAPGIRAASCWARSAWMSQQTAILASPSAAARLPPISPQPTRAPRKPDFRIKTYCNRHDAPTRARLLSSVPGLVRGGLPAAHHQVYQAEPGSVGAFELAKQGDVLRLFQSHSGKSQRIQTVILKIGSLLLGPFLGICQIRRQV